MSNLVTFRPEDVMIWCDIETTGLDAASEVPLEIGLMVTDLEGREIWHEAHLVYSDGWKGKLNAALPVVKEMHTTSNLWYDLVGADSSTEFSSTHTRTILAEKLVESLLALGLPKGEYPLCGSTINFDRAFLAQHFPALHEFFTYRNIDISSVKELCKRNNPELYAKLPGEKGNHRVLNDIRATINEYKFYRDNFLFVA